ncbi:MAG: hypothetical protein PVSMB8_12700 [Vulcanimicrobiaceae bacterium]
MSGVIDRASSASALSAFADSRLAKGSLLRVNVHYQAIVDIETAGVVRAEAFCRLGDGALGAIAPSEFLPHAERNGLMRELTEGVIVQVLADRKAWSLDLPVAINVSQTNLFETDFCERVLAILERTDTDASLVTFEVNDGVQLTLSGEERAAMHRLAVEGVRFSLDGFDPRRADFTALRVTRLPLSEIKIDARMLGLGETPDRAVTRSLAFARDSHLDIVVKSVEDAEQVEALLAIGCTFVQGYAFGAPMDSISFDGWLAHKVTA